MIDELIRQSIVGINETTRERMYQSSVEEQTNQLTVTSTNELHQRIESLKKDFDKPTNRKDAKSPVEDRKSVV